nr:hypothetical protein CFP56_57097 [Quercus suber]
MLGALLLPALPQDRRLCSLWCSLRSDPPSSLCVLTLNLSNLKLGGEISPATGDLRNLQFNYRFKKPTTAIFVHHFPYFLCSYKQIINHVCYWRGCSVLFPSGVV